jgi:hypothetical protein
MYATDAQATRERIYGRPARNGDEVDAFARTGRQAEGYRAGQRRGIKARHNRANRTAVRRELGQLARLDG